MSSSQGTQANWGEGNRNGGDLGALPGAKAGGRGRGGQRKATDAKVDEPPLPGTTRRKGPLRLTKADFEPMEPKTKPLAPDVVPPPAPKPVYDPLSTPEVARRIEEAIATVDRADFASMAASLAKAMKGYPKTAETSNRPKVFHIKAQLKTARAVLAILESIRDIQVEG